MKRGAIVPRGFHAMVYGPPSVGKTTLASQMPKPAALLDVEGGAGWLYCPRDLEGLDIYTLEDGADPSKDIESFLKAAVMGVGEIGKYRSIAIDTLAALRSRHLTTLTGGNLHIEEGDYGKATTWLRRVLSLTQFAPQMILWLNHSKEEKDGPRMVIRPSGMSATALNHCVELLDAIIFMGKNNKSGEIVGFLSTQDLDPVLGRASTLTKDRTGLLPSVMEIPGLDENANPPQMFEPFFKEVIKQLGFEQQAPAPSGKSKSKKE